MNAFIPGWGLIYTKPRHEKKVYARLNEINITSFLPTRKSVRAWHDRKRIIDEPLFPSYLFVYMKDAGDYYHGMEADGSLYFVRSGKEIARVSDTVINNIKLAIGHAEEIEVSEERFLPGQRLVISKGALTGLSCEVVDCGNSQKLLVRVDLLQRNLLLTLPAESLTKI